MEMMRSKKIELEQKGLIPKSEDLSQNQTKSVQNSKFSSSNSSYLSTKSQSSLSSSAKLSNDSDSRRKQQPVLKDLNKDIFSSHATNSPSAGASSSVPTITKPGRRKRRPDAPVNVDEIKPNSFYSGGGGARSKIAVGTTSLADDDDSDWEGMDGKALCNSVHLTEHLRIENLYRR